MRFSEGLLVTASSAAESARAWVWGVDRFPAGVQFVSTGQCGFADRVSHQVHADLGQRRHAKLANFTIGIAHSHRQRMGFTRSIFCKTSTGECPARRFRRARC